MDEGEAVREGRGREGGRKREGREKEQQRRGEGEGYLECHGVMYTLHNKINVY